MINTKKEYPTVDTYFIAWNNERTEIKANGLIETTQVMETALVEVDFYQSKEEYESVLSSNGVEKETEL